MFTTIRTIRPGLESGRHRLAAALSVATLLLGPSGAIAQESPVVTPGSRVRITAPSLQLRDAVAVVKDTTQEGLVVRWVGSDGPATLAFGDIETMDVSIRRESRVWQGGGLGVLVGGMAGVFAGLASGDDPPGFLAFSAQEKAAILGVGLGIAGGLVGLLAGAMSRHDVWAPVSPAPMRVTLFPTLTHGRTGAVVRIRLR